MKILLDYDPTTNEVTLPDPNNAATPMHVGYVYNTNPGFREATADQAPSDKVTESPSDEGVIAQLNALTLLAQAVK